MAMPATHHQTILGRPTMARTHMFLTVELDGARFVIDPGFGPFGSNLPLPLDGIGVPVGRSTHRMVREGDLWVMHGTRDGASIPAWVSTLEIQYPVDFEMANHFVATHSSSRFVNGILASHHRLSHGRPPAK